MYASNTNLAYTELRTRQTSNEMVGWVVESSGRGTLTLIVTCLFTIFLCTWVVIHPRVNQRRFYGVLFKLVMFVKAILAPELIAVEGLQEWTQCYRMKRDCAVYTEGRFKMVHAFYISMLSLRYHTPDGDRVVWPNQYTWLLQQGLIHWKDHASWGLSEAEIRDKSNSDSAVKLIGLCQVLWFVAGSIMRTAHGLPLSQLESMTLSYIPLFTATYFFWWIKPKDISTPTIVDLPEMDAEQKAQFESMAVSNKFDNEGLEEQTSFWNIFALTPRVFEKEEEDRILRETEEKARLMLRQRAEVTSGQPVKTGNINNSTHTSPKQQSEGQVEPIEISTKQDVKHAVDAEEKRSEQGEHTEIPLVAKEMVVSHWDPVLYRSKLWPVICLAGVSFGALHLVAWNTAFPTFIELWLWRTSAFVSVFSMLVFMHFEKVILRWGGPLTIISYMSPVFYFISRIVMMGEVFAALRAEDPAIYDTYVVSTYFVHFL